jgi:hypothetical protein
MASSCTRCGVRLGFLQRVSSGSLCQDCSKQKAQEVRQAKSEYAALIEGIVSGSVSRSVVPGQLSALAERAEMKSTALQTLHYDAFSRFMDSVLEDDILSIEEEKAMFAVGAALGIQQEQFDRDFQSYVLRLTVARVNDGRLPELPNPRLLLKKGEICHLEASASLLKEVAVREWQAGHSGFSFRVAKGMRYHTGSTRGRSVVVGTHVVAEDTGYLSVTSHRAVFVGTRKTLEHSYAKLVGMNVYEDGVTFSVTNRQKASTIQVPPGHADVIAAIINSAAQEE